MKTKNDTSLSLKKDTRGLSSVEYLILLVVIAVAGITVWKKVGTSVNTQADGASKKLDGL